MDEKELQQKLDTLKSNLLTAASEEAKKEIQKEINALISKGIEGAFGTKLADEITKLMSENAEVKGLKEWQIKKEEADKKNQQWIDEQIAKGKTVHIHANNVSDFQKQLHDSLDKNKDTLKGYTKTGRRSLQFEMTDGFNQKTVGNIAAGNFTISGTEQFVNSTEMWAPGRKPYEMRHFRDFPGIRVVPIGPAQDVYVIRDAAGEGAPTAVTAGSAKPQSDRDWVKTKIPITKIAHYYKIPEEFLEDITWLRDEITGVGVEELLALEDTLFLTGVASSSQFAGLNQSLNSTAFSASSAGMANAILKTTNYDVLVAAWTQLRILKSVGSLVAMHPADYGRLILTKDTTGQYIFGAPNANVPNLYGAPIVPHTAVTSDKYFLGDASKLKIGQRAGLTVRFYDQNEDDAIKNMVTVVIEERITFAADRADRFIYGDFSDDASAISASY